MKKELIFPVFALAFTTFSLMIACSASPPRSNQTQAQAPKVVEKAKAPHRHGRGRIPPKNLAALHVAAHKRHDGRISRLPRASAPTFNCVQLGWTCPVLDQGQCGSCWDFSGTEMCTSTFIKAGVGKNDGSFILSTQYTLDCYSNGGCNGDDNTTVLIHAKATGLPTQQQYGPYTGEAGNCTLSPTMTFYQISDWGFCTPNQQQGMASTQDIKNAMVAYGAIGCAVAADDSFSNYQAGTVFDSTTSSDIDHDVLLVGWDDTKGKAGAWLMQNSWSTTWGGPAISGGPGGYMWIGYGVNLIGTEAVFCTAVALPPVPPPPPPGPIPPGPTPPTPVPSNVPTITIPSGMAGGMYELSPLGTNSWITKIQSDAQAAPWPPRTPPATFVEPPVKGDKK